MVNPPSAVSEVSSEQARRKLTVGRRGAVVLATLLVIWAGLPVVPPESGLRFGLAFQVFFTVSLLAGWAFLRFLDVKEIPQPASAAGVMASIAGVYIAAVGLVVLVAVSAPQFGLPQPLVETGGEQQPSDRGKALFLREDVGCFRCHAIAGSGGTRGPDLTQVGARAGSRISGVPADQYLKEKIQSGAAYRFSVPEYVPIMPSFGQTLTEEQVADLVSYLKTLQ